MDLTYRVIRSKRRTAAIEISRQGEILVRCPLSMPDDAIEDLVNSHRLWIEKHLALVPPTEQQQKLSPEELEALGKKAVTVFPERVAHFAEIMGVSYSRITIRTQRTKWGSCSSKGNLNFNVLLMLAPPEVLDYIVVHELCHRKELNHSPKFWAEVEKVMPRYRDQEAWLKENGAMLMGKLF